MVHALIAGSFDPITYGHVNIIERAAQLFSQVTVAIVFNPSKQGFFSIEEREEIINEVFTDNPHIQVTRFSGLLVHLVQELHADTLVKGLRNVNDFNYELPMDHMNHHLAGVNTVYLATAPEYSYISSSLVREIAKLQGDVSALVPPAVNQRLHQKITLQ